MAWDLAAIGQEWPMQATATLHSARGQRGSPRPIPVAGTRLRLTFPGELTMSAPEGKAVIRAARIYLVSAAVGNEGRKARGGRHDQLPREAGKAEHKAGPRTGGTVKAADGADDDAGAPRRRLDFDVG